MVLNNSKFSAKATEKPRVGSTEVWDIIDFSNDDHPIHLHLVQFQIIGAFRLICRLTARRTMRRSVTAGAFLKPVRQDRTTLPIAPGRSVETRMLRLSS